MSVTKTSSRSVARRLPGEEGVWVFIVGDMSAFGLFFVVFAWYYAQSPELFLQSQSQLNQHFGAINTLLLLSSSWFVVMALNAYRKNLLKHSGRLISMAFLCGLGFGAIKFLEYGEKLSHGITMTTNDFFMFYYIYTGIHFLHLILGMLVLIFLFLKTRKVDVVLSGKDISVFEGGAAYWHMVDLLWIVLFPLLYLIR